MPSSPSVPPTQLDPEVPASYSGYPHRLPTASGASMTVVVDATHEFAFQFLWGMSLLERAVRLVERLGASSIHLCVHADRVRRAEVRRFPALTTPVLHRVDTDPLETARGLVRDAPGPVLLLRAHVVYDRRLIGALWQCPEPAAVAVDGAAALLLGTSEAGLLTGSNWDGATDHCLASDQVLKVDVAALRDRIALLRKTVPPRLIRVEDPTSLRRADTFLRDLAGKGTNDLIAEFLHPPLEFLLTRLVCRTPVTPNQVSWFNALLNLAAIPLLAGGWLWAGIACNLVRGVTDGVDGKLARLTLRESTGGDRLDHVVDRLYLPAFFLALGWYLGGGDPGSRPAAIAGGLLVLYVVNRLLATGFARLVGASSGDHRPIDRLVRRFWPKRNICVWLLLVATVFHAPLASLYAMAGLSAFMAIYRTARLGWELRLRRRMRWG